MKIGIAYTTHNRQELALKSIKQAKKLAPKDCVFIVVDDGSETPFPNADFRFEIAQGIAAAKNKCIELLYDAGCTHFFLIDDDCYPIVKDWYLPYINSGLNHLCMTFEKYRDGSRSWRNVLSRKDGIVEFHEPCGMMLFFTKICIDTVGGMDDNFGRWGYEHVSLSRRIFNAGLTPKPFLDIEDSYKLINSMDWEANDKNISSVNIKERSMLGMINKRKYIKDWNSKAYIPFKKPTGKVLTTYLTNCVDPQRGEKWEADIEQVRVLAESCNKFSVDLVVLNDCFCSKQVNEFNDIFITPVKFAHSSKEYNTNPYFQRWFEYREFLRYQPCDNVWLVDATDTELLREPFRNIQPNKLYVGWEREFIGCQWMRNHHKSNFSQNFIGQNAKTPLLNAGVIGGRYDIVMEFLDRICDMVGILPEIDKEGTDMVTFNWILYAHFNGRFVANETVTTVFKAFQTKHPTAVWRHK